MFAYKYLVGEGRCHLLANEKAARDKFVVRKENCGYHAFLDPIEYYKYRQTVTTGVHHEVITGACKFFVDIDMKVAEAEKYKVTPEKMITALVKKITGIYMSRYNIKLSLSQDFILTGGCSADKFSYHLLVSRFYHSNIYEILILMTEISSLLPTYSRFLDLSVY